MKSILFTLLAFLVLTSCSPGRESLFNGENLDGWTIYVEDPSITPESFFYVYDGMIETVGVPVGYLRGKNFGNRDKKGLHRPYPGERQLQYRHAPDCLIPGILGPHLVRQGTKPFIRGLATDFKCLPRRCDVDTRWALKPLPSKDQITSMEPDAMVIRGK